MHAWGCVLWAGLMHAWVCVLWAGLMHAWGCVLWAGLMQLGVCPVGGSDAAWGWVTSGLTEDVDLGVMKPIKADISGPAPIEQAMDTESKSPQAEVQEPEMVCSHPEVVLDMYMCMGYTFVYFVTG